MPLLYVPAPAAIKLPFGIFSVADFIESDDPHWETGVVYQPATCGIPEVYPSCFSADEESPAEESPGGPKTFREGVPSVEGHPFTVYTTAQCSPFGSFYDEAIQRTRDWLANGAERAVENEIALRVVSGGEALTGANTVDITPTPGTPVTVTQGLALLEEYIGVNGSGQGTILGNRRDILVGISDLSISAPTPGQQTLYTGLNTPVAALGGFDGRTGPDGTPAGAGESWLFALGSRPRVRRSDVFSVPRENSLNTGTNDMTALSEQTFVVTWECFTAAILVDSAAVPGGTYDG